MGRLPPSGTRGGGVDVGLRAVVVGVHQHRADRGGHVEVIDAAQARGTDLDGLQFVAGGIFGREHRRDGSQAGGDREQFRDACHTAIVPCA
jgi:hypothetical protein